jgi:hypothetical protein
MGEELRQYGQRKLRYARRSTTHYYCSYRIPLATIDCRWLRQLKRVLLLLRIRYNDNFH